jgi:pilus assembly protein CpaE
MSRPHQQKHKGCEHLKIKVLVIGRADDKRSALLGMLDADSIGVAAQVKSGPLALDKVESLDPDVVVIVLGPGETDAFAICERIYLSRPRCAVLMVADSVDADSLQKALGAGAMNLILWPQGERELQDAVLSAHSRKNMHLGALSQNRKGGPASKVITVFGTKGGIGKTTIAVNLAVKLAQMNKRVALIDLDLQFGDVGVFMDIDAKDTMAELVRDNSNLDVDTIRNYMVLHSSGVHVLPAPNSPEYADIVQASHVERIVNALKGYYDYVIIDTCPVLSETVLTAIECAGLVLFVLGMDISILRNAKICLNIMESLGQMDKIMMIVNREVEGSVTMKDVQKIVDRPIVAKFPSDWKLAVAALNKGVPFVVSAPNSGLAKSFTHFVQSMLGGQAPQAIVKTKVK